MALYLRWLEQSAKCNSMQICRRFESYRSHQGKGGIFSLVILIPPIYDHCQVRVMHEVVGSCPMYYSAILLSLALKKTADHVGLLLSALYFCRNRNRRGQKKKTEYGALRGRERQSVGSSGGENALWCWRAQKSASF